jgi:hypothetical protein
VGISDPNTVLDINSAGGGVGGWTGIRLKAGTSSVQSLSMGQVTAGNGAWIGMSQYNQAGYWKTEGTAAAVMVFNSDGSFIISTNCGLTANTDYNLCERLKIDAAGMVGIRATPSSWGSGVAAVQIGTTGALWNRASDGLVVLSANSYFNGTSDIQICTGFSNRIYFNNGQTNFERAASTSAAGTTPWATSMIISATGIACFSNTICAPNYAGGTSYTIDFVVVAGGGGGGGSEMSNGYGGGGGAGGGGGYLASSISVNCGSSYPIIVGTGGIGGVSCLAPNGSGKPGCPGTFSSAFGFIAIGGGGGAGDEGGSTFNSTACQTGGSGGGQGGDGGGTIGIAIIGQGNNGGPNVSRSGGGGGGALNSTGGNTGASGRQWLDGNYYAGGGGGGGGGNDQTQWPGGAGGGGAGSRSFPGGGTTGEAGGQAVAGAACSGGGGGGAGSGYLQGGMAGGSGVVIIRYPSTEANLSSIGAGLTFSWASSGGVKTYTFTAGTGAISW